MLFARNFRVRLFTPGRASRLRDSAPPEGLSLSKDEQFYWELWRFVNNLFIISHLVFYITNDNVSCRWQSLC